MVKEFLDKNKVPYQEFDVSVDRAAFQEMISLTHQNAVPQINIDGQVIIGYNEKALRQKLGIPG
jgi:glutaredoxin 3